LETFELFVLVSHRQLGTYTNKKDTNNKTMLEIQKAWKVQEEMKGSLYKPTE
jgi:hypothetical protein